jgi:acetyltransferase-like isoleucine patch superfamily enzyme
MIVGPGYTQPLHVLPHGIRIHPWADVDPTVDLGEDTVVWAYAHIMAGVRTGPHGSIGVGAELGRDCRLGESCRIGYGVFLPNRTVLGDRVFIGPRVVFTDDKYPRVNNPRYRAAPPVLEDDVAVGAGAVILPGLVLRRGCLVAAGAVVTHEVAPGVTVVGSPARERALTPLLHGQDGRA